MPATGGSGHANLRTIPGDLTVVGDITGNNLSGTNTGDIAVAGDMYIDDGSTALDIQAADADHGVNLFSSNILSDVTFNAGSNDTFDNAAVVQNGSEVTMPATGHGLSNSDIITIAGTTNYDGIYAVSNVQADTFDITHSFTAETLAATDAWNEASKLIVPNTGNYQVEYDVSITSETANHFFEWGVYINTTRQVNTLAKRKFSNTDVGSIGGGGYISATASDVIWLAVRNVGSTADPTHIHANVRVHQM